MFSGVVVFQKDEEFTTSRNRLLTVLPEIGEEYRVSFLLFITNSPAEWHSIIHFTIGGNLEVYGDRTPALFTNNGLFHFTSAINGNLNYIFEPSFLSLNTWHSIEISQLSDGSEVL